MSVPLNDFEADCCEMIERAAERAEVDTQCVELTLGHGFGTQNEWFEWGWRATIKTPRGVWIGIGRTPGAALDDVFWRMLG